MKKRITYDKKATGHRLREWRQRFRLTRKEVADRCGLTEKYYSDIERGTCGMSVETLISFSELYGFTLDYLIRGEKEEGEQRVMEEFFMANLGNLSLEKQDYCLQMLRLFVKGMDAGAGEKEEE